ncbi:uncharacterized protein B0I36DRAFT_272139, partial [Microdochium trichocladiopsis]
TILLRRAPWARTRHSVSLVRLASPRYPRSHRRAWCCLSVPRHSCLSRRWKFLEPKTFTLLSLFYRDYQIYCHPSPYTPRSRDVVWRTNCQQVLLGLSYLS